MAETIQHSVSAKKIVGSVFLGVLLASLTWLGVGYINRARAENNRREATRLYPELVRGELTDYNLERIRYLLRALPTPQDRSKLYGCLYVAAIVKPGNGPKALPLMLELTRDPEPTIRMNTVQMAAALGRGNAGVQQQLRQLAQNDPDARVRSSAQKCLTEFNAH